MLKLNWGIYFLLSLFCLASFSYAGDIEKCKENLRVELKNILASDKGMLNAQANLTAMKLAQKVLNRKGLTSQTIEAYTKSIIGNKTITRLEENQDTQKQILALYNQYGKTNEEFLDANESLVSLIASSNKLNDKQISQLMISLEKTWGNFDFNEHDFAIAWLLNKFQKSIDDKNSYQISDLIEKVLTNVDKDTKLHEDQEKLIAQNIAHNQLELKRHFTNLKSQVYKKYKQECLYFYDENNPEAQNQSIFAYCKIDEQEVLDELFSEALLDILNYVDDYNPNLKISFEDKEEIILDDHNIRKYQDEINNLSSNLERIIAYHKSSIAPDTHCNNYGVVNKEEQTMSIYSKDGKELFTSKGIIGAGTRKLDRAKFNSDSKLRSWTIKDVNGNPIIDSNSGKPFLSYSSTTAAGIFYTKKDLSPQMRKMREYDEEFNDRVLVLTSKNIDPKTGDYIYDEEIQAIHGVPNDGPWMSNRDTRMKSFTEDITRRLSSGCVNLEGYTYDLVNEMMEHQCPIYILPEDPENYFFVKNRQLNFSTANSIKKNQSEVVKIEGAQDDKNIYAYTPRNLERYTKGYQLNNGQNSVVLDYLLKPEKQNELYERAKILENDQYEDFLKIAAILAKTPDEGEKVFLNLYNAYYRLTVQENVNLDFKSHYEKIALIMQKYKTDFDDLVDDQTMYDRIQSITFYH